MHSAISTAGTRSAAPWAREYAAPQIAGRDEPFHSEIRDQLKGRTQALEDLAVELLARGLSVRDIEDAFKDESGRLLLSRTAVSEIGERLWADYQEFATRDPIALAEIMKPLDEPLDDPSALHDLAQEHGPRFPGQPLGSGFDAKRLVERETKQR